MTGRVKVKAEPSLDEIIKRMRWLQSYFASTVGRASSAAVEHYIENQKNI